MDTFAMFIHGDEFEDHYVDEDTWAEFYDAEVDDDCPDEYYE